MAKILPSTLVFLGLLCLFEDLSAAENSKDTKELGLSSNTEQQQHNKSTPSTKNGNKPLAKSTETRNFANNEEERNFSGQFCKGNCNPEDISTWDLKKLLQFVTAVLTPLSKIYTSANEGQNENNREEMSFSKGNNFNSKPFNNDTNKVYQDSNSEKVISDTDSEATKESGGEVFDDATKSQQQKTGAKQNSAKPAINKVETDIQKEVHGSPTFNKEDKRMSESLDSQDVDKDGAVDKKGSPSEIFTDQYRNHIVSTLPVARDKTSKSDHFEKLNERSSSAMLTKVETDERPNSTMLTKNISDSSSNQKNKLPFEILKTRDTNRNEGILRVDLSSSEFIDEYINQPINNSEAEGKKFFNNEPDIGNKTRANTPLKNLVNDSRDSIIANKKSVQEKNNVFHAFPVTYPAEKRPIVISDDQKSFNADSNQNQMKPLVAKNKETSGDKKESFDTKPLISDSLHNTDLNKNQTLSPDFTPLFIPLEGLALQTKLNNTTDMIPPNESNNSKTLPSQSNVPKVLSKPQKSTKTDFSNKNNKFNTDEDQVKNVYPVASEQFSELFETTNIPQMEEKSNGKEDMNEDSGSHELLEYNVDSKDNNNDDAEKGETSNDSQTRKKSNDTEDINEESGSNEFSEYDMYSKDNDNDDFEKEETSNNSQMKEKSNDKEDIYEDNGSSEFSENDMHNKYNDNNNAEKGGDEDEGIDDNNQETVYSSEDIINYNTPLKSQNFSISTSNITTREKLPVNVTEDSDEETSNLAPKEISRNLTSSDTNKLQELKLPTNFKNNSLPERKITDSPFLPKSTFVHSLPNMNHLPQSKIPTNFKNGSHLKETVVNTNPKLSPNSSAPNAYKFPLLKMPESFQNKSNSKMVTTDDASQLTKNSSISNQPYLPETKLSTNFKNETDFKEISNNSYYPHIPNNLPVENEKFYPQTNGQSDKYLLKETADEEIPQKSFSSLPSANFIPAMHLLPNLDADNSSEEIMHNASPQLSHSSLFETNYTQQFPSNLRENNSFKDRKDDAPIRMSLNPFTPIINNWPRIKSAGNDKNDDSSKEKINEATPHITQLSNKEIIERTPLQISSNSVPTINYLLGIRPPGNFNNNDFSEDKIEEANPESTQLSNKEIIEETPPQSHSSSGPNVKYFLDTKSPVSLKTESSSKDINDSAISNVNRSSYKKELDEVPSLIPLGSAIPATKEFPKFIPEIKSPVKFKNKDSSTENINDATSQQSGYSSIGKDVPMQTSFSSTFIRNHLPETKSLKNSKNEVSFKENINEAPSLQTQYIPESKTNYLPGAKLPTSFKREYENEKQASKANYLPGMKLPTSFKSEDGNEKQAYKTNSLLGVKLPTSFKGEDENEKQTSKTNYLPGVKLPTSFKSEDENEKHTSKTNYLPGVKLPTRFKSDDENEKQTFNPFPGAKLPTSLKNNNENEKTSEEKFNTILEFLYKYSKNPLFTRLKEQRRENGKKRFTFYVD